MVTIPVILGSTREGRQSVKAARFVVNQMRAAGNITPTLVDLKECAFPMLQNKLFRLKDPSPALVEFSRIVGAADALVVVSPEYNGSFPGVLKNALDYLLDEYKRKPVGIVTVSAGPMGGRGCLILLRQFFNAVGAVPVPAAFPINNVGSALDDEGQPADPSLARRAREFIDELLYYARRLSGKGPVHD